MSSNNKIKLKVVIFVVELCTFSEDILNLVNIVLFRDLATLRDAFAIKTPTCRTHKSKKNLYNLNI